MRVDLPGEGQWAEIRGPETLTGEDEMIVRSAVKLQGKAPEDGREPGEEQRTYTATAGGTVAMELAMLARVITSWSRPDPITEDSVRGLPLAVLRPLRKAVKPHLLELNASADPNP